MQKGEKEEAYKSTRRREGLSEYGRKEKLECLRLAVTTGSQALEDVIARAEKYADFIIPDWQKVRDDLKKEISDG
ncbi:MAG: hypothetical protein KAS59_09050 [Alphaproteobacteria bacterium]|nr:hypothetical protein [Alphaproteobacteria bacterium]